MFDRIFLKELTVKTFEKVCDIITGGTIGKIIKDTIHANGIDIGIYTQNFENEFISLTDIARYKSDDPTAVIQNWMRNRDVIEFLDYGKDFIIQILTPSNSRGLKNRQEQTHLQCHRRSG